MVSSRFTLCSLLQLVMASAALTRASRLTLRTSSVGCGAVFGVRSGMTMTCPMRKFSADSPGLAAHISEALTPYITVRR